MSGLEATRSAPSEDADRRRYNRVKVNLLGRCMFDNRREFPCQVVNFSPGGASVISPYSGSPGEKVIAYIDHIGRIEGTIVRSIDGGFAMTINASQRKRDKLADVLTWLANRHVLNLPEDRRNQLKQQWKNMTPQERQAAKRQIKRMQKIKVPPGKAVGKGKKK